MASIQRRYFVTRVALLGWLALSSASPTGAQPLSMSAEDFAALCSEDQRALLVHAFERQLEHARNLYLEVEVVPSFYKTEHGKPVGPGLGDGGSMRFRQWRLAKSYRVDMESRLTVDGDVYARRSLGFDAREGTGRRVTQLMDQVDVYGAIDTAHASILRRDPYHFWLDGEYFDSDDEYLFRYLLNRQDEFLIEAPVEDGLVRLSVSFPSRKVAVPGRRQLLLDSKTGFLPIEGDSRYEEIRADGSLRYFITTFAVHDSRLVGDVWMPVKVTDTIESSSVPDQVAVRDITVLQIEHGTVQPADLEIIFSEGTRVTDMTQGITYLVDSQGKPMDIEPILAAIDPADIPAPPSGTGEEGEPAIRGPWLNVRYLGVGIAGLVVAFLVVWGARATSRGGA